MAVVIVDIDGTVADCGDRARKYLETDPKDWDKFYDSCAEDKPIKGVIDVVGFLNAYNAIVFVSGRRESCREDTEKWILKNMPFFHSASDFKMYLRGNDDHRHDTEVKPELLEKLFEEGVDRSRILCILEDRNSMVKKWRELGYTCLQVAEGDF